MNGPADESSSGIPPGLTDLLSLPSGSWNRVTSNYTIDHPPDYSASAKFGVPVSRWIGSFGRRPKDKRKNQRHSSQLAYGDRESR